MITKANGIYSSLSSSYKIVEQASKEQQSVLTSSGTSSFDYKLASSQGGFRPHVSAEVDLLRRVKRAGFGHYLSPLRQPSDHEFSGALDKAELLMTKRKQVNYNLRRLIRASRAVYGHYFGKLTQKFHPLTIADAKYFLNTSASAGYPYYRRKGRVLNKLVRDAETIPFSKWRHYPISRSFRVQFRLKNGTAAEPKVRVIYPYPGMVTLLELRFVRPFVDWFTKNDTAYITGKSGGYISGRIKQSSHKWGFSSDISGYDQNMPNEVLYASFAVLRHALELDEKDAELFNYLSSYFISANLVSRVEKRGSIHVHKKSGIPSGTGFTNLIGTIAHSIILAYNDINFFDESDSFICSDDNLTFTAKKPCLRAISQIYQPWGLQVNKGSTEIYRGSDKVYFLGFTWMRGVRVINPHLALNQLVYHTQFITDLSFYDRVVSRAASVLLNGANGASYFNRIFPDLDELIQKNLIKDRTFTYLPGYRPPTDRSIITSDRVQRVKENLDVHLKYGWMIR